MQRFEKVILWSLALGVAGFLAVVAAPKMLEDLRALNAQEKRWNELQAARKVLVTTYPSKLDPLCRNGRGKLAKLYDECGDQVALFEAARAHAARDGKVLLVSYGAEWCIWCHVFDEHIRGGFGSFSYAYGSEAAPDRRDNAAISENPLIGAAPRGRDELSAEAKVLQEFVSRTFVLVHVDAQFAKTGRAVLKQSGADRHYNHALPFIYVVDKDGKFAGAMKSDRVEVRRDGVDWYRGYDRRRLQVHLTELSAAAR